MLWCDILSYLNATHVAVNIIDIKESKIPSKQIYIFSPSFQFDYYYFHIHMIVIDWTE